MSVWDLFKKIESKPSQSAAPVSYCICGLGNPGAEYANTRHNVGFMALDQIAAQKGVNPNRLKFQGLCCEAEHNGTRILLLKPQTYMNNSGESVRAALDWYKIPPEHLIVLCDDLELLPGRIRIRAKGSAGGHNGLKSIIYHLNSEQFPRVRMGIGRPSTPEFPVADYVLGRFPVAEQSVIRDAVTRAAAAALEIIDATPEQAASKYNGSLPK